MRFPLTAPSGEETARTRRVLRGASLAVVGIGATVLAGWVLDIGAFRTFLPGLTNPMVGVTASCFVLLGSALLLDPAPDASRRRKAAAGTAATIVVVVGGLVLGGFAFGWDLGLDRFLYRASARPFTGAMALPSAVTFILVGVAVLAHLSRRRFAIYLGQTLAATALVVPLLSLIGRAYGVPALSSFLGGSVVMALHTAATFILLISAVIALRSGEGVLRWIFTPGPGGWIARRLLIPSWLLLFGIGWLRLIGQDSGIFGTELGAALMVIAAIVVISVLLVWAARSLGRAEAAQRETKQSLWETQGRSHAVLASIGDGVVTTDARGTILSINRAMEQIAGWPEGEVVGRAYGEAYRILDPEGRPVSPDRRFLIRAMATGDVVRNRGFDTTLESRDGRRIPVAMTAAPILDERGRVIGGVDVIRDVSQAQEVDAMKSALVSTVSHELRTPLTMISGFAELLITRALEPDQTLEAARQIHTSAQRLDRLIEDLLSVSRIEAGRLSARRQEHVLAGLVQEARSTFPTEAPIRIDLDGVDQVIADRDMTVRILTNLLSNAVKYSPEGEPITVRARLAGDAAEISVMDSGIGMSPEERAQLFEKFFRADRPEVRNARGTGLGLFITRSLVELQGGRISVESEPERGSTFTFTLPLVTARGVAYEEAAHRG